MELDRTDFTVVYTVLPLLQNCSLASPEATPVYLCFTQSARVRLPVTVIVFPFFTGSGEALTVALAQRLIWTRPDVAVCSWVLSCPFVLKSCARTATFQVVASLLESRR
ncbi:hypothetical protein ACIBM4_05155 [Streptomyces sp. NPDC050256]|uniref:hypothetical protein n=1 Tax=Streptomyces sp. NPDC050256 TaxID=3365607 RepID=UPI003799AE75